MPTASPATRPATTSSSTSPARQTSAVFQRLTSRVEGERLSRSRHTVEANCVSAVARYGRDRGVSFAIGLFVDHRRELQQSFADDGKKLLAVVTGVLGKGGLNPKIRNHLCRFEYRQIQPLRRGENFLAKSRGPTDRASVGHIAKDVD